MTDSGAWQRIRRSEIGERASLLSRSREDWGRISLKVRGPLLTLALAIVFDQLTRNNLPVPHPFSFLLLTVIYSTTIGGLQSGILSSLVMVVYALNYLADPGAPPHYTSASAYSLVGLLLLVPVTVWLVLSLRTAAEHGRHVVLSREEAERLDRRLAFLTEANQILASSVEYETTLRSLARLVVPTLADWCAI